MNRSKFANNNNINYQNMSRPFNQKPPRPNYTKILQRTPSHKSNHEQNPSLSVNAPVFIPSSRSCSEGSSPGLTFTSSFEYEKDESSLDGVNRPHEQEKTKSKESRASVCPNTIESSNPKHETRKISEIPSEFATTTIVLPCVGVDGQIRQYVWRINNKGDLIPVETTNIPPPRTVLNPAVDGLTIIVPLSANYVHASGGLLMDQMKPRKVKVLLRDQMKPKEMEENCSNNTKLDSSSVFSDSVGDLPNDISVVDESSSRNNTKHDPSPVRTDPIEDFANHLPVNDESQSHSTPIRYKREELIGLLDEVSTKIPMIKRKISCLLDKSHSSMSLNKILTRDIHQTSSSPQERNHFNKSGSAFSQSESALDKNNNFLETSRKFDTSQDGWTKSGDEALKNFRSCLNKLTADNFEAVLSEIKCMRINDDDTILSFIKLLYDKATAEPLFAPFYVDLTIALKGIFIVSSSQKDFKHFLITACQNGFEEALGKLKKVSEMTDDARDEFRRGFVGCIQFIAKLFLSGNLTHRIAIVICTELAKIECPESVEPLCKFLQIVGRELEMENRKKDIKFKQFLEIMKVLEISRSKYPSRINFMILDLLDQRKSGWKPRMEKDTPKMLGEVAKESGFVKREGVVGRYVEVEGGKGNGKKQQHRSHDHYHGSRMANRGRR